MPITMNERHNSPRREVDKQGRTELLYWAKGSTDDQEMLEHALDNLPSTYADMPRQSVKVEPLGGQLWDIVAVYEPNSVSNQQAPVPPPVVGDSSFSFDTTGGTQHITQARALVQAYPHPDIGVVSDWKNAIGVTSDGVNGIDIVVPALAYKETHQIANATVVGGLVGAIHNLTGKTNNATFKGFAAGELLFLGAQGERRSSEDFWTITFMFQGSRNATLEPIGEIEDVEKKGHQYVDVQYEDAEDETASMLVKEPIAVRVYKIYEEGDFSALGI